MQRLVKEQKQQMIIDPEQLLSMIQNKNESNGP